MATQSETRLDLSSRFFARFFALALLLISSFGCKNTLEEFAVKNSNESYYFDAKQLLNRRDYDGALTKLLATTTEFKARRDVTATIASAYAGRCGLDFIAIAESLANQLPSSRLLPVMLTRFGSATTGSISDCKSAETWMRTLAPADDFTKMTPDEATFTAFVSLASMGAVLGTYADLDNDGVVDPGFDSCNTAQLPDADARAIGVSLNLTVAALSAAGGGFASSIVDSVTNACSSLPAGYGFCGVYDPTAFTTNEMKAVGGLIKANDIVGLGTCNDTTANCACP